MHLERFNALTNDAIAGLSETFFDSPGFDAVAYVRAGVASGRMELWRVDGHSWAVTEVRDGTLILMCYQGENGLAFLRAMIETARRNNLQKIRYWTARRGMARFLKSFKPVRISADGFEIGV